MAPAILVFVIIVTYLPPPFDSLRHRYGRNAAAQHIRNEQIPLAGAELTSKNSSSRAAATSFTRSPHLSSLISISPIRFYYTIHHRTVQDYRAAMYENIACQSLISAIKSGRGSMSGSLSYSEPTYRLTS